MDLPNHVKRHSLAYGVSPTSGATPPQPKDFPAAAPPLNLAGRLLSWEVAVNTCLQYAALLPELKDRIKAANAMDEYATVIRSNLRRAVKAQTA